MTFLVESFEPQCNHQLASGAQKRIVRQATDEFPDIDGRVSDDAHVVFLSNEGAVGKNNSVVLFQTVGASAKRGKLDGYIFVVPDDDFHHLLEPFAGSADDCRDGNAQNLCDQGSDLSNAFRGMNRIGPKVPVAVRDQTDHLKTFLKMVFDDGENYQYNITIC